MDRKSIYNRGMEIQTETPLDHAIRLGGGITKFAKSLGLKSHMVVYQWTKTRVPAEHCPAIERETGAVIRCEDLRPDIEWCVLRQSPELVTPSAAPANPAAHRSQSTRRKSNGMDCQPAAIQEVPHA